MADPNELTPPAGRRAGTYTIYNDDFMNWQQISAGGMTTDAAGNMWSYEDVGSDGDIVRITQTGAFRHFSIGDVGLVGGYGHRTG